MWGTKIYCIMNQKKKILHLHGANKYRYFHLHQLSECTLSQNEHYVTKRDRTIQQAAMSVQSQY